MKCPEVQEHLSAYLDGEVPEDLGRELRVHLQVCADCRAELAKLSRLEDALAALAAPPAPDIRDKVLGRLSPPVRRWWRSLSLAASLVLGLTLGGILAGKLNPYNLSQANGNGAEVLALEEVFRDYPQGSWGQVILFPDEEEPSA